MVDYGPGDEIVCIRDSGKGSHRLNKTYICVEVGPTDYAEAWRFVCPFCITEMVDAIVTTTNVSPNKFACSCIFRKKLDFKKLCDVDETIKIKENA